MQFTAFRLWTFGSRCIHTDHEETRKETSLFCNENADNCVCITDKQLQFKTSSSLVCAPYAVLRSRLFSDFSRWLLWFRFSVSKKASERLFQKGSKRLREGFDATPGNSIEFHLHFETLWPYSPFVRTSDCRIGLYGSSVLPLCCQQFDTI